MINNNTASEMSSVASDSVSHTTTATTAGSNLQRDLITTSWACVGSAVTVTIEGGKTLSGRIYCYDYTSKNLILSKAPLFAH